MLRINKIINTTLNVSKILTFNCQYNIHHDGRLLPRQFNHKWHQWEKDILYSKQRKLVPTTKRNYSDILFIPGYDATKIGQLYLQYMDRQVPLSPQNVCVLLHSFITYQIMTLQMFDMIQPQAYRHKGQYKTRSIYGGLRAAIIYNRRKLMDFFLDQYKAGGQKFTLNQVIQIMEVLAQNNQIGRKQRTKIWKQYFRDDFLDGFQHMKRIKTSFLQRFFTSILKLGEKDQNFWNKFVSIVSNNKGWSRIPAAECLYKLSAWFQPAKQAFDKMFEQLAQNPYITSRYNLTQMRYYTPLELIKNLEENPVDYYPKIRTIVPADQNAEQWNQKYQQYLKVGAVKEEQQIIKDKSKSFAYAIKQRYQSLKADNQDFREMKKQQFESLFGNFEQIVNTIKQQDVKIEQVQKKKQQEEQEKNKKQEKKGKGDKKDGQQKHKDKGKGKQKDKDKDKDKADKPKQKKQKAPPQQK